MWPFGKKKKRERYEEMTQADKELYELLRSNSARREKNLSDLLCNELAGRIVPEAKRRGIPSDLYDKFERSKMDISTIYLLKYCWI